MGVDRPAPYPEDRPGAATIRSRLMLEVASELVAEGGFEPKQVRLQFRPQGADHWHRTFFGSDALSAVPQVASGETQFAILNPAVMARRALAGAEPFDEPIELRAIATIPSYDQFGLAVSSDLDVDSVDALAACRSPLRVSLRGDRHDHSVHRYVEDVLGAIGLPAAEIEARGGELVYQPGIPHQSPRVDAIRAGEVNVIVDEGIYNWVDLAIESGYRFLSLPRDVLDRLADQGYQEGLVAADDYELLDRDIQTLDFSGFLIYTHERVEDELVQLFCEAMITRSDRISWQGGRTLPLEHMVSDTIDAPIPIPFHPAAEEVWRRQGLLSAT